ncbi:MAG: hypothetical protein WC785_02710 [Tatlockia sp.]|jgi:hypothetical protein
MPKILSSFLSAIALYFYAFSSFAGLSPIHIAFVGGETTFASNSYGTAHYAVTVNRAVPPNVALTLFLAQINENANLTASPITTGTSFCPGINTVCGIVFSLYAGQSCCLKLHLTSNQPGNYNLQPLISTTPVPTYSAKASSALTIRVVNPVNSVHAPGS